MNYEFTGEEKVWRGHTLHRMRATVDMPEHGVKVGDLGGWIEREDNLVGNAWVYGNAQVYGNAWVISPMQIQGSKYYVNIAGSEDGEYILRIGCQAHSISWWLKNNHEFATNNGEEDFEAEAMIYINAAAEWAKLHPVMR